MPRILVVDDLAADRAIIKALLGTDIHNEIQFASNGREALEQMAVELPHLVVTDLQMPEMDGLELVRAIRSQFTAVPVILTTAHGSEATAIEALKVGAASYVPKSHLSQRLRPTVDEVLSIVRGERSDRRLIDRLDGAHFEFRLDNDPEMIPPVVDLVQGMIGVMLYDPTSRLRVGVALEEALLNGLYHGNLEISAQEMQQARQSLFSPDAVPIADQRRSQSPYSRRTIHFRFEISKLEARFVIRDEGPGFDHRTVHDPSAPGGLDQPSGRGLVLIQSFMDEVRFNDTGNEIVMTKRRDRVAAPRLREEALELLDLQQHGNALVIIPRRSLSSLVEARVQQELRHVIKSLNGTHMKNVVIDFEKVKHFGSSMLEAMRIVALEVRRLNGKVAACNVSPVGKEILNITRFEQYWPVEESRKQALEAVSKTTD